MSHRLGNRIKGLEYVPVSEMTDRRPIKTKRKKFVGPEADHYDQCKKKMVRIDFRHVQHDPMVVRLDWVDRFTIGVRNVSTNERILLNKSSIHTLRRDNGDGTTAATTDDGRGDANESTPE